MRLLRQLLFGLMGLAFLNANALGAHLHLCFDGMEPATSVHVFDGSQGMHHVGAAEKHNDTDVKVTEQALAKVIKFTPYSPFVPPSWNLPQARFVATISQPGENADHADKSVRRLLPPQRGPPA